MRAKIKKFWFYLVWLVKFMSKMSASLIVAPFVRLNKEYDDLWLIMELPKEARDNGYWLYKYVVKNHPEINVRYVLAEDSPDYDKMPAKEKIIKPYSWQHYLAYILCTRSISTHIYGACPGRYYAKLFFWLMPHKEEVFLQHGITKAIIPLRGFSSWTVTASSTEAIHLQKSGHARPDKILQTGFCRFDNLTDTSKEQNKKIILIMPTFRRWLGGHTTVDEGVFLQSKFYKKWQSVLLNKKFTSWVEKNDYKVVFYPHRQMQSFANLFETKSNNISIATSKDYDVQDLLRRSSLLVTDYSSVLYDFSYMKKPVLLYPFDQKEFYTSHLKYSGNSDSLGEYCHDENLLIKSIVRYGKNEFSVSKKTLQEVNNFFTYTDQNNCKRNFNAIKDLGR